MSPRDQRGTAAVEAVLIAPVLLILLALLMAGGEITSDQAALRGIAREAGRIAVTAADPAAAVSLGRARAQEVATGYGLDPSRLTVTIAPGSFARGSDVLVTATYSADLSALPSLGLIPRSARLTARHLEPIDLYISR
jgi:Flp pilus assembly protein TadG